MNCIEQQRTDLQPGDLINPNNKHVLTAVEVAAYNRYTQDLNRERHEDRREFLKDQRHRFFVSCGQAQPRQSTRRAIAADLLAGVEDSGSAARHFECVLHPGALQQLNHGDDYYHSNAWGGYTMTDMIKRGELIAHEIDSSSATAPDQIKS